MDKSLGTNLHLWGFFTHIKKAVTRESIYTVQPLPPPPPLQCWTRVHAISPEFQHCIGGRGGGGGVEATHFKTDNSAFLKLRFKNTKKLMQLHMCPKELCPHL